MRVDQGPKLTASERVIGPDALKSAVLVDEFARSGASERVTQHAGSRTAKRQGCPVESPTPHLRLRHARTPRHHDLRRYQPARPLLSGRSEVLRAGQRRQYRASSRSSSCERRWPTGRVLRGTVLCEGHRDRPEDQIRPSFARGAGIAETIPPQVQGVATVLRASGFTPTAITLESGGAAILEDDDEPRPTRRGDISAEIATATAAEAGRPTRSCGPARPTPPSSCARPEPRSPSGCRAPRQRPGDGFSQSTRSGPRLPRCAPRSWSAGAHDAVERATARVERRTFETALQRALEMSKLEGDAYGVIARALAASVPRLQVEMLVADSRRAHFHGELSTVVPGGPVAAAGAASSHGSIPGDPPRPHVAFPASSARSTRAPACKERPSGELSTACVPIGAPAQDGGSSTRPDPTSAPSPRPGPVLEYTARLAAERVGVFRAFAKSETQAAQRPAHRPLEPAEPREPGARPHAGGRVLRLAYGDLDHFKDLNDTHGHEAGDQALRLFARVMNRQPATRRHPVPVRRRGVRRAADCGIDNGDQGARTPPRTAHVGARSRAEYRLHRQLRPRLVRRWGRLRRRRRGRRPGPPLAEGVGPRPRRRRIRERRRNLRHPARAAARTRAHTAAEGPTFPGWSWSLTSSCDYTLALHTSAADQGDGPRLRHGAAVTPLDHETSASRPGAATSSPQSRRRYRGRSRAGRATCGRGGRARRSDRRPPPAGARTSRPRQAGMPTSTSASSRVNPSSSNSPGRRPICAWRRLCPSAGERHVAAREALDPPCLVEIRDDVRVVTVGRRRPRSSRAVRAPGHSILSSPSRPAHGPRRRRNDRGRGRECVDRRSGVDAYAQLTHPPFQRVDGGVRPPNGKRAADGTKTRARAVRRRTRPPGLPDRDVATPAAFDQHAAASSPSRSASTIRSEMSSGTLHARSSGNDRTAHFGGVRRASPRYRNSNPVSAAVATGGSRARFGEPAPRTDRRRTGHAGPSSLPIRRRAIGPARRGGRAPRTARRRHRLRRR